MQYRPLLWNRDTYDWRVSSPLAFQTAWIPGNFSIWASQIPQTYGLLTLQHDLYTAAVQQAPETIGIADASSANLVTVSECTNQRGHLRLNWDTSKSFPEIPVFELPQMPALPSARNAAFKNQQQAHYLFFVVFLLMN
jgi:hypothetical protein